MPIVEQTSRRLVLQSGSIRLSLDKDAGTAKLHRKFLFWARRPVETQLAELKDVTVDKSVDRASGIESFNTMLITQDGAGWAFPAADKTEAQGNASKLRSFLGLPN